MNVQPVDSPQKARLYLSMLPEDRREAIQRDALAGFEGILRRAARHGKIPAGPVVSVLDQFDQAGLGEWR